MARKNSSDEDPLAPFRAELRAHCYRMLGSAHDAEDVLQEVSLRAWRGRGEFEGRSSLRTWLHRIAVNACLNELERKERRVLPADLGPASGGDVLPGEPLGEVMWLEPLPDDPELRAAERETVELAFVAAVQHLPPNQRAALIMFDVLGFSAREIADAMDTTTTSVNSALQRARAIIDGTLPQRSQQATLAELGDERQRQLVKRYSLALQHHDLDGMLELLTEDATWSMPPLPQWYRGRDAIAGFLANGPYTVEWRHRAGHANGQLAVGAYRREGQHGTYVAYALDVLELRGDRIAAITAFLDGSQFPAFGLPAEVDG
jgi:RNA polymerase sigma-70 factor (ECF subfamily)